MLNLRIKVHNLESLIYELMLVCVTFIQIGYIYGFYGVVSSLFAATFVLTLLLFILYLIRKRIPDQLGLIGIIIVLLTLFSAVMAAQDADFDYFKKALFFINTVICLLVVCSSDNRIRIGRTVFNVAIIQSLIFLVSYFTGHASYYQNSRLLTFGYDNPNFTGMWLSVLIYINLFRLVQLIGEKRIGRALFILILIVSDFAFLLMTGNRSSLVAMVVLGIGSLILVLAKNKKAIVRPFWVAVLPILCFAVYFLLIRIGWDQYFSFLVSKGKTLDSRADIWREALDIFRSNPLLGDYYRVVYKATFAQLHNMYVDVGASYGIITLLLFVWFIFLVVRDEWKKCTTASQKLLYWGITAFMVICGFEATFVSGSAGFHILACSIFLLNQNDTDAKGALVRDGK